MTASLVVGLSGRTPPSFLRRTVEAAARRRAESAAAAEVTFAVILETSHAPLGASITPTLYIWRRMRSAASLMSASLRSPRCSIICSVLLLRYPAPGISMSKPCASEAEWVAPQSDITKPSKPLHFLSSSASVVGFSHDHTPFTLLYEHIIEPTPLSAAPRKGG